MGNAAMSQFSDGTIDYTNGQANVDVSAGMCPWIVETVYDPPFRDYGFDPELLVSSPPIGSYTGVTERWKHLHEVGPAGFTF